MRMLAGGDYLHCHTAPTYVFSSKQEDYKTSNTHMPQISVTSQ